MTVRDDEVHVWQASLCLEEPVVGRLRETLAADEIARAERYRFAEHRRRFVVSRGILRSILARYAGCDAARLRFSYGPKGKPALERKCAGDRLRFNASHSGDVALFVVAPRREVGIDIERIRPGIAAADIARRFFSPREAAALADLPESLKAEAFFHCWTRKEAYVKARGEGLLPLNRFDVSLRPGEPAALLRTLDDPEEARRWSLRALTPGPGYAAALAVEGHGWRLSSRVWSGGGS